MKNLKNYLMLLSFLSLTLFMSSCRESQSSADVNQAKIYTYYELFYNQNTDKTTATARFTFGDILGTPLELASGSKVSCNGQQLSFKALGNSYQFEYIGVLDTASFEFIDLDGNTFTNVITFQPIAYPATLDTIARNAAFELFWQGTALGVNEEVYVTANGINEGDARVFVVNNAGATSIILDKNKLEQMGQGAGTLWMDRIHTPAIQQSPSVGGVLKGKYRPSNKGVIFN